MTTSQDRTTKPIDPEPGTPPQAPRTADQAHDLDAEIVRDLELDGQADDVRGASGGAKSCPREH